MPDELKHLFSIPLVHRFVGWTFLVGLVWTLFSRVEEAASPALRTTTANWLGGLASERTVARWATTFADAFDTVFGTKRLSWKCLWRSFVASLTCLAIACAIRFNLVVSLARSFADVGPGETTQQRVGILILGLIVLLIADYFSLLETRLMISVMARRMGSFSTLALLVIDYLLSGFIFFATYGAFWFGYLVNWHGWNGAVEVVDLRGTAETLLRTLSFSGYFDVFTPFATATYFTSFWLWLYALSGILIRASNHIARVGKCVTWALNVKEKPFIAIATIVVILITLLFVATLPFALSRGG